MADLKAGITTSFNGGEIAPYLAGRIDHEGFSKCVRKLVNGIPQIGGGIKKFYGTEHVCSLSASDKYLLVPFHHEERSFLLVFKDGVVDVVVDGLYVSLGLVLPPITDYNLIRYEQANDVLIFCSPECPPFKIEYRGANFDIKDSFYISDVSFDEVPYFPLGYNGNYTGQLEIEGVSGSVVARIPAMVRQGSVKISYPKDFSKTEEILTGKIYTGYTKKNDYAEANSDWPVSYLGDITVSLFRVRNGTKTSIKSGVYNARIEGSTSLPSEYQRWENDPAIGNASNTRVTKIKWVGNKFSFLTFSNVFQNWFADSKVIDSDVFIPMSSVAGHEEGDTYSVEISVGASCMENGTNIPAAVRDMFVRAYFTNWDLGTYPIANAAFKYAGVYTQTKSSTRQIDSEMSSGVEKFISTGNLVGRKIKIYQDLSESTVVAWYQGLTAVANSTIVWSDGKYYLAKSDGTTKGTQPIHTEGVVSDGGVEWAYLHSGYVTATITQVHNEYEMTLMLKKGEYLPVTNVQQNMNYFSSYRWSIWGADLCYPSQVFFNNGRLGFFTNTNFGTYYNMSRTDNYYDFSEDSFGEVLDTDAIQGLVTGGSFSNKINWVISRENVYCGSHGTEFVISGLQGLMTPSTTVCKPVSFTGGDKVSALKYMTLSMFVGAGGNNLNVVNYDYATESYIPLDISYIASHLLSGKVRRITGTPRPDNCIYLVTQDCKFVQLVNSVAEEITAFSDMYVGDNVKDVTTVFKGNDTDVYILRYENDEMVIEKLSIKNPTYMLSTRRFSDASASVAVPAFANEEVYVKRVSDGQFYKVVAAEDGTVANKFVGDDILVGKPMPFIVHGIPSVGKKLEGMQQKSVRFLVRLLESGAFSYGSSHNFNKWYDYNNWSTTEDQEWDSSHKLMTGDIQLPSSFGYMQGQNTADGPYPNDTSVALNIFSDTPEPFNLLMVSNIYV